MATGWLKSNKKKTVCMFDAYSISASLHAGQKYTENVLLL